MKAKKIFRVLPCLTLLFATTVSSCSENNDDHPQSEKKHHFLMSAQSDNSFFITSFENFNEGTSVSYDKAITLPTGHLFMEKLGKYVYLQSGSMYGYGGEQTLHKYEVNANGQLSSHPVGSLSFPGSPNVVEIIFANDTKAYAVTCASRGQLIVFNPSTMSVTKEIDLSPYAEGDKDPDGGNGIVRDGKLFLPLNQAKSMKEILATPAQVAVIDVATDKVEKVIKDDRATSLGMVGHTSPVMDEAGNIYFNTGPRAAMMCQFMPGKGYKDGLLRIKKGETDFDKDFYMSLQTTEGAEVGSYGMYMTYGGNGKIYTFLYKPSLVKDPNDQTYIVNKCYVPYEIDVNKKTGRILPLPASCGWAANAIIKVESSIYFGEHTDNGIGFYRYDMATGKGSTQPSVKTPSGAYKVISLD